MTVPFNIVQAERFYRNSFIFIILVENFLLKEKAPFTVYNASAGSGKTFTLVKSYLSLLLEAPQKDAFKHILAITFTNKAVGEMKSRILESLKAFSTLPVSKSFSSLFSEVQQETRLSKEEIAAKSESLLRRILHNYAAFEISTIDGFTHRVLRTFAKDLGIPVNFEVELDTESILNEAVDRVISKAGEDKSLTQTLIDFTLTKADDDKSWDISRELYSIAKLLVNENNLTPLATLKNKSISDFTAFKKEVKQEINRLEKEAVQSAEVFFSLLREHHLENKDFKGKYVPGFFEKVKTGVLPYPTKSKWQENITSEPLYNKTQTAAKKNIIDGLQPQIAQLFRGVAQKTYHIEFLNAVRKNLTSLSLLQVINTEVETLKKENNVLLISEFNKKISESIKDQPAPFIYERLGERYTNYFIDEFQDTSSLQWSNLQPLISNSLSTLGETGQPGTLNIVGDAKQSIYRWRGGEAGLLMGLSAGDNPFPSEKNIENLPNNFRSKPEIVNFNNHFFKHISRFLSFPKYKELFEAVAQEPKKEEGGYVNISFIEAQTKAEEEELYPQKVLETITQLTEDGHAKKEICILVRKKKEGIAVANYLSEQGIPIISSETLLVKQSDTVTFITTLLEFSWNTNDFQLKFELLDFLYTKSDTEEDFFEFMNARLSLPNVQFFQSLETLGYFFSIETLQQLPLYDAVEYVVRSFQLGEKPDAYLQFYLDVVYEYVQQNRGGIAGFMEFWHTKEEKLSIVAPEGEDAVQIMTIHKAKGLEFPVVIYPFANEAIDDTSRDAIWVNLEEPPNQIPVAYLDVNKKFLDFGEEAATAYQELLIQKELDALNTFYVALTRAENQLYIISKKDVRSNGEEKTNRFSGFLINFLKEIGQWDGSLQYDFGSWDLAKPEISEKNPAGKACTDFVFSAPADHHVYMLTQAGMRWGTVQAAAIEEGNIVHELLSEITIDGELKPVLKTALEEGIFSEKEMPKYQRILKEVLMHPELKPYFSSEYETYTEKEIIFQGHYLRLDRLALKGNSAVIIDYKTGNFSEKHIQQIKNYAAAITDMGYTVEKKMLVYLGSQVAVKIV